VIESPTIMIAKSADGWPGTGGHGAAGPPPMRRWPGGGGPRGRTWHAATMTPTVASAAV